MYLNEVERLKLLLVGMLVLFLFFFLRQLIFLLLDYLAFLLKKYLICWILATLLTDFPSLVWCDGSLVLIHLGVFPIL